MCVYLVANLCAGRIGLGWAYDAITFACYMFMHSHAYLFNILIYFCCLGLFWLSLSPSLFSICVSLLLWHPNANLLRPGTLFVPGHPFLLILHLFLSSFVMRRPNQTSLRRLNRTPTTTMMIRMEMLVFPVLTRCLLDTLTFCHTWQKGGSSFGHESSHTYRRRVSIGDFC